MLLGAAVIAMCAFISILFFASESKNIETINPEYRDIKNEIELSGKIQSKNIYKVTSTETAKVDYVYVKAGDEVKKGDTLYTLDSNELEKQLEQLKSLQETSSKTDNDNEMLKNAQNCMDYEAFNNAIREAKAKQTSTSTSAQLSAQIAGLEEQLEAKKIKSTIDGTVVLVNVKEDQVVMAGAQSITVADVDDKYVTAYIMQQDYNSVNEGMKITLQDEQTGLNLNGTVTYKDYIAQETVSTDSVSQYKIEVESNETIKNAIGSNITINICIENRENTLTLPLTCVLKDDDSAYIYIKEDGAIKKVNVETGLRDDDYIEILNGVDKYTSVVSDPTKYMEENS